MVRSRGYVGPVAPGRDRNRYSGRFAPLTTVQIGNPNAQVRKRAFTWFR